MAAKIEKGNQKRGVEASENIAARPRVSREQVHV
jgi:hypothetical protein